MQIDFSPLKPFMNELLLNLLLVLFLPFLLALFLKLLLIKMRVPRRASGTIASLAMLYGIYRMFMFVT